MDKEIDWLIYALAKMGNNEHQKAKKKVDDFIKLLEEKGFSVMMKPFCDEVQFVVFKSRCYVAIDVKTLIKAPEEHVLNYINREMKNLIDKNKS